MFREFFSKINYRVLVLVLALVLVIALHTQQPIANFVVVQNNLGKWCKIFLPTNFRGATASFPPSPSPSPSTSVSNLESFRIVFDLCTRIAPSEIFDLIKDNFEKLMRIEGDSDGYREAGRVRMDGPWGPWSRGAC